jgi:hypothetical protein
MMASNKHSVNSINKIGFSPLISTFTSEGAITSP